jgi:hypothetical protein
MFDEFDRIAVRASWLLIAMSLVYLAVQIVRAAHVWPFA